MFLTPNISGVIPVRILKQRTVAVCCLFSALYGMANVIHITLLPTYLQTVHGLSATLSGVCQLPITFSNLASMALAGLAISAWGRYVPLLWCGPLVYLLGAVLLQQLRADSTAAQYVACQVPAGVGFGAAVHSSILAVQAVSSAGDMPVASVMEVFSMQLGRAVGISVAQSLFVECLRRGLRRVAALSGEQAAAAAAFAGDDGLRSMVAAMEGMDAETVREVRGVLNEAITTAFVVPVAATAAAAVVTWFVERRTMDVSKRSKTDGDEAVAGSVEQPMSEEAKTGGKE